MSDDTFIVQRGIVGKGEGNDIYVFSSNLIDANASITISDTQGNNSLQLIGGLSITDSIIASDTMQLTLNNGTTVTVLNAGSLEYIIGGDPVAGVTGSTKSFSDFATDILSASVPSTGTATGGMASINSDGTANTTPPDDEGSSSSILAQAQTKSSSNTDMGTTPTIEDMPALDSGYHWSENTLTYSYNDTKPEDYADRDYSGFITFPEPAKTSAKTAFADISTFTPLTFNEIAIDGDIELNSIEQPQNWLAFAFEPGTGIGGDVFLNNDYTTSEQFAEGGIYHSTVVHELGHALGLKHPFSGDSTLPSNEDNTAYTLMSYTNLHERSLSFSIDGDSIDVQQISDRNPSEFTLYDVIALQAIYGVNTTHNNTDTTYTVEFGTTVREVIWDAGGIDLIDASSATGSCTVDLREQKFSSIDVKDNATQAAEKIAEMGITKQSFIDFINETYADVDLKDDLYTGEMNLAITKGAIIENVTTGSANDSVQDNSVDNIISTGAGDDTIILSEGGFDTVNGGTGMDTVQLNIASSAAQVEKQTDGSYIILADSFAAELIGVENLQFTDTTTLLA